MRVRHRKALCRDKSGACFRDFLRCSRYSSCGCDKLSKIGEFYLHYLRGCKVSTLLFCASVLVVSRVVLNSARHRALVELCASSCIRRALSVSIPCASRLRHGTGCFGNSCIALHAARRRRLKFYVRCPAHRSTLSLDIRVFRALRVRAGAEAWPLHLHLRALRLLPSARYAASDARR